MADATVRRHKPDRYAKGTPARALAEFGDAWYRADLYGLLPYVQRSWVLRTADCNERMQGYIDTRSLLGFLILGRGQIREATLPEPLGLITFADVPLRVWYSTGEDPHIQEARIVARLVYEGADGLPRNWQDPYGSWGVNPVSLLDESRRPADVAYTMSRRVG